MQIKLLTIGLTISWFAIFCVPQGRADCDPRAREIVQDFLRLDFEGYRLGSEGHAAIWQLTDQNGEPPAIPIAVTKGYRIISAEGDEKACHFRVGFSIYGYISESRTFQSKVSDENGTMDVKCIAKSCKLTVAFDEFQISPHPGKFATVAWLKRLEKIRTTAADKRRERSLQKQVASLR